MKRIVFTVTSDISTDQRMQRICHSLRVEGYDVILVGRALVSTIDKEKLFSFETKRIQCHFNSGFFFYMEFNLRLLWCLFFANYDVICSIDLDTILPGVICGKIRRKKIVYDAHEYYTESPEIIDRPMIKKFWEGVARWTIPYVDYAYTVNQTLAEILSKRYKVEFDVIRNLPLENYISSSNINSQRIILYQGVLNKGRGLESLVQAMKRIDFAKLRIAGDGDITSTLVNLVSQENLEDRITFVGKLSPDELVNETNKAWLGINILEPSVKNYYYSLANKFFDYMMAGIPSLSMNFPEYSRVNQEVRIAHLIDDIEVQTIVDSIKLIHSDKQYYNLLKENCNTASKLFSWQNEEQKLKAFMNRVTQ